MQDKANGRETTLQTEPGALRVSIFERLKMRQDRDSIPFPQIHDEARAVYGVCGCEYCRDQARAL